VIETAARRPRIVVGVDGSEPARRALLWAAEEARLRDADLEVVHAWQHPTTTFGLVLPADDRAAAEAYARHVLDVAVEALAGRGLAVEPILVDGPPARALIEASAGAALVVVGSRGRGGFRGLLLGSVSGQAMHHARCPVVVVR
jgi:nucleotide-binding universal stress UspA family protein